MTTNRRRVMRSALVLLVIVAPCSAFYIGNPPLLLRTPRHYATPSPGESVPCSSLHRRFLTHRNVKPVLPTKMQQTPSAGSERLAAHWRWVLPLVAAPILLASTSAFGAGVEDLAAPVKAMCEEPYGILPCSTSVGGNVFLMAAFGFFLVKAANLISEGSELLLEVLGPGVVGGLLLPVLGAFADAMIIVASGIGGTVQEAQREVSIGLGVLAGSIVILLTLAWGGCLVAGRCDLTGPGGTSTDRQLSEDKTLSLTETGVTTDEQTRIGALIMAVSCLPYLIIQLPLIDGHPAEGPEAAAVGAGLCLGGLGLFSGYQVVFPWLQRKRVEEARLRLVRARAVARVSRAARSWGGLLGADGGVDGERLRLLFDSVDIDGSGALCGAEVRALMAGLAAEHGGIGRRPEDLHSEEAAEWMRVMDRDSDGGISFSEFEKGIRKWILDVQVQSKVSSLVRGWGWGDTHTPATRGRRQTCMSRLV